MASPVYLAPTYGAGWQGFDASGNVLNGGKLNTYAAGTTSALATYTSNLGTVSNANPIILNSDGRPPSEIWFQANNSYKVVLTDSTGVTIETKDNLTGVNDFTTVSSVTVSATTVTAGTVSAITITGTNVVGTTVSAVTVSAVTVTASYVSANSILANTLTVAAIANFLIGCRTATGQTASVSTGVAVSIVNLSGFARPALVLVHACLPNSGSGQYIAASLFGFDGTNSSQVAIWNGGSLTISSNGTAIQSSGSNQQISYGWLEIPTS